MPKFFERLFGGAVPEPKKPMEPKITEQPRTYQDPNQEAWTGTAQGNIDRAKYLETNPVEEMRLKKGALGKMLRQLVPDLLWDEMSITRAMTDAEVAKLPKIDRNNTTALQEIADAITARIQQEQTAHEEEPSQAAK